MVLHERSNNTVFFAEHLQFQEKLTFTDALWINCSKLELKKKQNQDTMHFEIVSYRVLHERTNIAASFAEHLTFQEKLTFTHALWIGCSKLK